MSQNSRVREIFSTVVPIRPHGAALPLFFLHGVGGVLPEVDLLLGKLDAEHPVYGIQAQAFDPEAPALLELEAIAACYLRDIRAVVPDGPYGLIGFSFGGMVAFEMAQQIRAQGCEPPALVMLDSMEMSRLKRRAQASPARLRTLDLLTRMSRRLREAFAMQNPFGYVKEKIVSRSHRLLYSISARLRMPIKHSVHNPYHVNWFAAVNYVPKPYAERFYLLKARDHYWEPRTPYDLGWGSWASEGVEVREIPGDHVSLFTEPNVSILARHLNECLQRASVRVAC